jgi:hypothetical protein
MSTVTDLPALLAFSTRRLLRRGALAALAAMLFAQGALALAACDVSGTPSRGAALAMSVDGAQQQPCHEAPPAVEPLCLAHCQAGDPSLDKAQAPIVVLPVAALPSIPFLPFTQSRFQGIPETLPPASPPARILFRTLLI